MLFKSIPYRNDNILTILIPITFLFLIGFSWYCYQHNIDLYYAVTGYGPMSYVYKTVHPDWFLKDYPGGVEALRQSGFMTIYVGFYKIFGIEPETLMPYAIGLDLIMVACVAFMMTRALDVKADFTAALLVAVFAMASGARNTNLSQFDPLCFTALYYNAADFFKYLSIILILKNRFFLGWTSLSIAFVIHPMVGIIAGVFIAFMLLARDKKRIFATDSIAGILLLAVIAGIWLYLSIDFNGMGGGIIPAHEWIDLVKMNNAHFFSYDIGLFTHRYRMRFLPFLSQLLLAAYYIYISSCDRNTKKQVIYGFFGMLILVAIGIVVPVWTTNTFLIRLTLSRSNDIISFIALAFIIPGIWNEILKGDWKAVIGAFALTTPFFYETGFPLALTYLLVAPECVRIIKNREYNTGSVLFVGLAAAILLLIMFYFAVGLAGIFDLGAQAYTGLGFVLSLNVFSVFLLLTPAIFVYLALIKKVLAPATAEVSLFVILIFCALVFVFNHRTLPDNKAEFAKDYMDVQLWARANSDQEAFFMPDPSMYYGWRDFSRRSSFGSVREWTQNGWFYTMNYSAYAEGIKRFNEFGVDIKPYLRIEECWRLYKDIAQRYYEQPVSWFAYMAKKYGIDYFIFQREKVTHDLGMPVIYRNASFIVVSAPELY